MHILRNCEVIKQVWRNLGINSDDNTLFAADLLSWFTVNAKANAGNYRGQPHWSTIFLFAVWSIWLKRNAVVFHNKPFPIDLHFEALQRVKEFYCAANWKAPTQSVHKPIRWEKPPMGWIKLNTDGSLSGDLGLAGGGGVFRNEEGEWILGYSRHIGITSGFMAELWAIQDGLLLCVERNFQAVEIEMDAKVVCDVLCTPTQSNLIISPIVDDCRQLASRVPQIRFKYCFREANRCVDGLARMGGQQAAGFSVYDCPPAEI
ncbi:hypothetical protein CMV_018453 [Castanea mollissima]|uniref:RNase H type-1 domain-containing protein n=1 Tax=Castanea mollissima TaxID=60419 RepID=A0A8J4VNQ2_9ROSI|nr:hypothetical protein CMV_018453 [Castanea mollissima]